MTLKCTIIDDEPLAVELLASYVRKTPFLSLHATFSSAVEAVKDLKENKSDILFLDIQMPELSGIEFARIIPKETKIIFTTAFSQYAIEGYKVSAVDYLLKPISYDDFLTSVTKVYDMLNDQRKRQSSFGERFFFVRSDYKLVQVRLDDILYVEGLKDYVRIYLDNGDKPVVSLMNMKNMEECLPYPEFMRVHRSYIVHLPKVKVIDRSRIVFGDTFIPISDSYKENIMKNLGGYCL